MQMPPIIAGDTLNFQTSVSAYPASAGWTLKVRLIPRGSGVATTIAATASGDDYLVQVPAGTTAAWTPGPCAVRAWVEKGAERYSLTAEETTIEADPATLAAGTDTRTAAEIALANVIAFIQKRGGDSVARYKINGREIERYPLADLIKLRQHLEAEVAAERRARGLEDPRGTARTILVRMR